MRPRRMAGLWTRPFLAPVHTTVSYWDLVPVTTPTPTPSKMPAGEEGQKRCVSWLSKPGVPFWDLVRLFIVYTCSRRVFLTLYFETATRNLCTETRWRLLVACPSS
ncbi:hypothetical protein EDD85DRAFT_545249 [Armillaria nabsnona]|nr:hypothetical protein EDD85DRAFT_545249 [Armillaria nabsnona]